MYWIEDFDFSTKQVYAAQYVGSYYQFLFCWKKFLISYGFSGQAGRKLWVWSGVVDLVEVGVKPSFSMARLC